MVAGLDINAPVAEGLEFASVVDRCVFRLSQLRAVIILGGVRGHSSFLLTALSFIDALSQIARVPCYPSEASCFALAFEFLILTLLFIRVISRLGLASISARSSIPSWVRSIWALSVLRVR